MAIARTVLTLLLLCVPAAVGHAAPDPTPEWTRLLADWTDDCGGDGGAATGSCRGSHDLLALDVREAHDAQLGDAVVFRLYLDSGQSGLRRDVLSMKTSQGDKTFAWQTSDEKRFTGTGFDRVSDAVSIKDGTRYYVEGWVRASAFGGVGGTLGGKAGDIRVDAYAGGQVGDFMPGGCHNNLGDCVDTGESRGQYIRPEYKLRGTGYYVALDGPANAAVEVTRETRVTIQVRNSLNAGQVVALSVSAGEGASIRLESPASGSLELPSRASGQAILVLQGLQEGPGAIQVTAVTDLGGRTQLSIPYTVGPCESCGSPTTPATTKASPLPLQLALAALALAARRKS
jgi:hypothetical protein